MNRPSQYSKDLSCVVIGKNAEGSIARLLDSVISRTPPEMTSEIIYVDSASTDRTVEIVRRYPVTVVQLSPQQPLCASAGRFVGTRYASGTYVAFFDSDMELFDGWLERALKVLDGHPEIGVVSGVQVAGDPAAGPKQSDLSRSESRFACEYTDIRFAGSAAVFRREVLEQVGTWNPFIVSDEEPELCLRIRGAGYRIVELACPSVRHFGYSPPTLSALLARRRRRLFLGYGQVMRYHFRTGYLGIYLRERGWVVFPLLAALAAMVAGLMCVIFGNVVWLAGLICAMALVVMLDVGRCRSLYKAIFHIFHRGLILEGTIRGLFLRPHRPSEYPCEKQEAGRCVAVKDEARPDQLPRVPVAGRTERCES